MAETENKYVKLISDEAKQKIIDASVQNLSARPTSNATEMKKRFVMPIVNKEAQPSLADQVDRVATETDVALGTVHSELNLKSLQIQSVYDKADDNAKKIKALQENVSELSENDACQKTLIEAVESQSDTNRDNIEQLFGLAYGNSNEIGELSYTVDQARGADVTAAIDSDFKLTIQLVNSAGHAINQGVTIDLPLEEFVVSGVYDEESKRLVLTLKAGKTLSIPIGDLVEGLISDNQKGVANGVASLDENGKVPAEQLPESIGGGLPEGFNPEDYVKFTDYATENKAGVVRTASHRGVWALSNGLLELVPATDAQLKNRAWYMPVTCGNLDYALKVGITTNTKTFTDEEKTSACEWIGAVKKDASVATNLSPLVYTNDKARNHYLATTHRDYVAYNIPMLYEGTAGKDNVSAYLLTATPVNDYHCANKKYVDDGFVAKYNRTAVEAGLWFVYVQNHDGVDKVLQLANTTITGESTIPFRDHRGALPGIGTPQNNYDAANKKYVDDALSLIESTVSITIEGTSTENYTANVPAYRKNDPFAYIGAVCDGDDNHVIIGYSVAYSKFILRDLETGETFKCESWNINE